MVSEQLQPGELHVWRGALDIGVPAAARLRALLSDDERARAARFHFERDRTRYIAGRALLRMLLARYTGRAADQLGFAYGAFDKPRLDGPGPSFNLSHSGGIALFGFSAEVELGIDLELDNRTFAGERIPEQFFSAEEVAALRSLPDALQPRAFLECWTRKEAFIKARGDGLSLELHSFTVTLGPRVPAALTRTAWCTNEPDRWSLIDLSDPEGEYVAAAAARIGGWRVIRQRKAVITQNSVSEEER